MTRMIMNNNMSDEDFHAWVVRVAARIAPHLRTDALSQDQCEELDRRLSIDRPAVRKLTDSAMKTEILKLLTRQAPMDGAQIVAALIKHGYAPKNAGFSAIYALLSQLKDAGLVSSEEKPTEPKIAEYAITDQGSAQVSLLADNSDDAATLRGRKLRPSPATE